jgi:hypothetical protein
MVRVCEQKPGERDRDGTGNTYNTSIQSDNRESRVEAEGISQADEGIEAEIARLEREGKEGKYDRDAIDELDWFFNSKIEEQQSLFGLPEKEPFKLAPEELTDKEKLARAQDEAKRKGIAPEKTKLTFPAGKGIKGVNVGKQRDLFGA